MNEVFLSVVSHDQSAMVNELLSDIAHYSPAINVLVTSNVPESASILDHGLQNFCYIKNANPQGYGANHNAAFRHCDCQFFCVINPDVRLLNDPFPALMACMVDPMVGLVAPKILDLHGNTADSARYFPTPLSLLARALRLHDGRYPVDGDSPTAVDWVAGMFMFFRAEAFRDIGGFDENFFLYYEDIDICARLWRAGWKVMLQPMISVVHAAQRTSRKNPRYMFWHLSSMTRYFVKYLGRYPQIRQN